MCFESFNYLENSFLAAMAGDMVNLQISSTVTSFGSERRFALDSTLHIFKVICL